MNRLKSITAVVLVVLFVSTAVNAGKVVVPEGTELKVRFDPAMQISSGKLQPGISISIYLAEDVKVGGKTIIEAGAEGTAKVEEIIDSSRPGKPGAIKVAFVDLGTKGKYKTAEDAVIKLSGTVEAKGKSRKIVSWLFILGAFISGTDGEIDTTLDYPAKIVETVVLESE
ncbi:MAG: hypothetical protein JW746_01470 [Candidatus Krumholzibacteriota bacterium]|nr:hypothetical protein [Candidatus Krumholzibacteriota bacterium]